MTRLISVSIIAYCLMCFGVWGFNGGAVAADIVVPPFKPVTPIQPPGVRSALETGTAHVSVKLLAEDGQKALSLVDVNVMDEKGAVRATVTDSDGIAKFDDLVPGRPYTIRVTPTIKHVYTATSRFIAGAAPEVIVTVQTPPTITGHVLDRRTGQPIKRISVSAHRPSNQAPISAVTDDEGRFILATIPGPGVYTVGTGGTQYTATSQIVKVEKTTDLTLKVAPRWAVKVTCSSDLKLPDRLLSSGGNLCFQNDTDPIDAATPKAGEYVFNLPEGPGRFVLPGLLTAGYTFENNGMVQIKPDAQEIQLKIVRSKTFPLTLVDTKSQRPVAAAQVSLTIIPGVEWFGALSDAQGIVQLPVFPGKHELTVISAVHARSTTELVITSDLKEFQVKLDPGLRLVANLHGSDGKPIADAKAELTMDSESVSRAVADAQGRLTLTLLPAARGTLIVSAPNFAPLARRIDLTAGKEPPLMDIQLTKGIAVTFHLQAAKEMMKDNTTQVFGSCVAVVDQDTGAPVAILPIQEQKSDATVHLMPGKYLLFGFITGQFGAYGFSIRPLTVNADEISTTLELKPPTTPPFKSNSLTKELPWYRQGGQ